MVWSSQSQHQHDLVSSLATLLQSEGIKATTTDLFNMLYSSRWMEDEQYYLSVA